MAEMSPVELLRAAAARVRERADNASAGPWRVLADPQDDAAPLTAVGVWSSEEAFVFECHDTMRVDAAWIALMHPGLAEPLAEILEAAADGIETDSVHYSCGSAELQDGGVADMAEREYGPALRLARGVLGVPDVR